MLDGQHAQLHAAARTWADALKRDKMIYVFGSGHSRFIAGELY